MEARVERRQVVIAASGVTLLSLALAGCAPLLSTLSRSQAQVSLVSPAAEAGVMPSETVRVQSEADALRRVSVKGPRGRLQGEFDPERRTWSAMPGQLQYGATYRVVAVSGQGDDKVKTTDSFSTAVATELIGIERINLRDDVTVGVGMPITFTFTGDITDAGDRALIENAIAVDSAVDVEGAWAWTSSRTVEFRPKDYWPANDTISVRAPLMGLQLSGERFMDEDSDFTYRTGDKMVAKVDAKSYSLDLYKNDVKQLTIPITLGKEGFETRSGIKVVSEKLAETVMDAASGGTESSDPEYYNLTVRYAMRITTSGEFIHAAPWSVGSQGYANVSHGCIGMSTANAATLYRDMKLGDIVDVRGTGRRQDLGNGITVWNLTWGEWLQASATGQRVV